MPWEPPPRGAFVDQLAAFGEALGDGGRSVVSLEAGEVLDAARRATGLVDAGDAWFEEPLARLCRALEDEARLHLAGRLRARAELQLILENRLRLVAAWKAQPSLLKTELRPPLVVTGLGRSGTTLLHELLACDPQNRAPLLWELVDTPIPGREPTGDPAADPRARLADRHITLMDQMVPAFHAMHENRGFLPTECIFAFAHQCSSDQFTGLYNVPSYTVWRAGVDQSPIYEWHRKMLLTLGYYDPGRRFVLKAPSHLSSLALLFATYPEATVVITHRDPLRVVGSLADMMATLHWMHSDHVDHQTLVEFLCAGLEMQMDAVAKERDAGTLPSGRIYDVLYADLVADPLGTVRGLYAAWDLPVSEAFATRLEAYVARRHRGRAERHDYRFEDTGLDLAEHRQRVAPYQERFGVPSEV